MPWRVISAHRCAASSGTLWTQKNALAIGKTQHHDRARRDVTLQRATIEGSLIERGRLDASGFCERVVGVQFFSGEDAASDLRRIDAL